MKTLDQYRQDNQNAREITELILTLGPDKAAKKIDAYRTQGYNPYDDSVTEPYYTMALLMTAVYVALYGEHPAV